MDCKLSNEAIKKIDDLTNRIARAQGLDEEVARELRARVEDKILGYISGDVAIDETEALSLAKRHFGNCAQVGALLSTVYDSNTSRYFHHQLLTVGVVGFVAVYLPMLLKLFAFPLFWALQPMRVQVFQATWHALMAIAAVTSVWVMWQILIRWGSRVRTWVASWSFPRQLLMLAVLFAFMPIKNSIDGYLIHLQVLRIATEILGHTTYTPIETQVFEITHIAAATLTHMASFACLLLWIWWCVRHSRGTFDVFKAGAWATLWSTAVVIMNSLIRFQHTLSTEIPDTLNRSLLFKLGYQEWHLRSPFRSPMWVDIGNGIGIAMGLCIIACALFWVIRKYSLHMEPKGLMSN